MTDAQPNAFLAALEEARGGDALKELHHEMLQLIGQVRSMGKKGSITVKINIALSKGANVDRINLTDEVKVVGPEPDREITVLFVDENNRLTRRHPNQPKLPEMEQPARRADIRAIMPVPARTSEAGE